ncbi:D-alanyl-D-alanine carboxypeptidase [Herbiconiux moechotypicola]|uniref:Peptidase S11 D-alanyl-D-alanine carboxypeptidase A N-terminal domain-containing protein n=1 Tax=Herbiconiux moechotypicola TaxID=637393 RepID=A0ABN3E151_9MICO|nr:D-alanyl-D-alanine carboxypeptidase [Herbiconiux moechotypicola]MCS5731282.1 D-alanyl-D-alanine carboxypeptidase [Herbiconiux moechotypicola]
MTRRHSPAVYRRRRIAVGALLLVLVMTATYFPVALLAPVPAAAAELTASEPLITPATALSTPAQGTSAIALPGEGDDPAGLVLGASGSTDPVPIASITKTVTALVVLDAMPITDGGQGPDLTMTDQDAAFLAQTIAVGGSWASVYPGQVLSERQVIEIMMLESANNYSLTLTTWAFGSVEAYLAAATTWLADRGLTGTTVVDTSGLDPGSRSTAHDLLVLGALATADPVLGAIVATASDTLPQLGQIDNTNDLLGTAGIDGVKTGTTDEAGYCLLFAAEVAAGDRLVQVVGVVLGAPTEQALQASVLALLQSAAGGFQTVQLATAGEVLGSYTTAWGDTADIVAAEDVRATVWSAVEATRSVDAEALESGASGTEVGTARFTVTGVSLDGPELTVPVELGDALDGADAGWRLANPGRLFG